MHPRTLYISYDGMTDPLGQSQVLPYLEGLAAKGYEIFLISAEKKERYQKEKEKIEEICKQAGINWFPVAYTKTPPVFSTLYDLWHIKRLAKQLHKKYAFRLVHCRSYIAAFAGLMLKRKYDCRFVFDMRGFWADERVEGGIWNLKNPLFRWIYHYFKNKEKIFLAQADYVISLTQNGKLEIETWKFPSDKIPDMEVIPCCANLDLFSYKNLKPETIEKYKAELGIVPGDFVVSYLGSLGSWYMVDEMLRFFKFLLDVKPHSKFLVITRDPAESMLQKAKAQNIPLEKIIVRPGMRHDIPGLISLSNFSLFFIQPVYSKKASSPTKLGEILGMGVPVVCNAGVGDVDLVAKAICPGCVAQGFADEELQRLAKHVANHSVANREFLRQIGQTHFSLQDGIEKYGKIYQKCLSFQNNSNFAPTDTK